ncbi:MAG: argininosuccinate synthase, partial [Rhodothermales bacterium]|nr:argininosuccinate synthase [Rhodothermales bacterium]
VSAPMSVILAFSGGLDTSFCVPFLKETLGEDVITVTVNTGGITREHDAELRRRSSELGSLQHETLDGRHDLFRDHLSFLIKGNVLRGSVYPLCVGPERVVQARHVTAYARKVGASRIAHGSTGAGNDQVRFDVAMRVLADDLEVLAPIRDHGLSRAATSAFLEERGFSVPARTTSYSINDGLWGTTIGGAETLTTETAIPDEAYPHTVPSNQAPDDGQTMQVRFEKGIPVALDGEAMDPVSIIETLNEVGARHGVGRDIHVGDTILGIKGRIGFEAPAATILISAHRELEKIVLTKWQRYQKDHLGDFYGMLLHEGQYFDPVMRDIEALLDSSQSVVVGDVSVRLHKGKVSVLGCSSPFSMFDLSVATYGETNALWDGRDAEGFSRIAGVQAYLASRARERERLPSGT